MDSSFELVFNEEEFNIGFEELMVDCQPTDPKVVNDAEFEEMILELHKKVHKIIFEDSSSFVGENVKNGVNLNMECLRPHSNYFLTLCLVGDMKIELTER
ncbi:hypothetical protein K7X08_000294 [Anisodus acutangulus]|uniref:Uncharacterized protein n=1 Tax=Anisodus acutangulus TaxID=402998 RepID=A0A9Q1M738_9SOLA|nr:hypothetical protein K7X08_000294 [Anisodus acutangulus]